jgi:signal recognition particle GTPase
MSKGIDFIENTLTLTSKQSISVGSRKNSFSQSMDSKTIKYFSALRTKPFMLLAGISGTGKSRIVRKLAQASITEELQKNMTLNL